MRRVLVAALVAAFGAGALAVGSATVASAAHLRAPVTKAPPPVTMVYNWTGFYCGGHVGGAWGDKDWVAVGVGPLGSHNVDGFIGGGQVGYNYQVGRWVFGVEADFSWADVNGSHVD